MSTEAILVLPAMVEGRVTYVDPLARAREKASGATVRGWTQWCYSVLM